jgi:hypothetical protein
VKKRKKHRSEGSKRVSEKISVLRHEGIPQKQAVGEAYGMERSGRLKRHGRYVHKRRGRRKGGRG